MNVAIATWLALAPMVPAESKPAEGAAPEAAPTEAAPTEAAPTEAAPTEAAPADDAAVDDEPAAPFELQPPVGPPAKAAAIEKPAPAPVVREAPPPDRPIRWRVDLGIGGGSTFVSGPAFFAFTPARRHLPGFGLNLRGDVRLAQGRFFVGGGLGYRRTQRLGSIYDFALDLDVIAHDPHALFRGSFMAVEGLDLYAQAAIGPGIVLLYASDNDGEHADQRSIVPSVEALGGLTLYLPKRWLPKKGATRVTGGLDLAMGYEYRGTVDVAPTLDREDDAIPTQSPNLGEVDLRGLVWRIGVFIRVL